MTCPLLHACYRTLHTQNARVLTVNLCFSRTDTRFFLHVASHFQLHNKLIFIMHWSRKISKHLKNSSFYHSQLLLTIITYLSSASRWCHHTAKYKTNAKLHMNRSIFKSVVHPQLLISNTSFWSFSFTLSQICTTILPFSLTCFRSSGSSSRRPGKYTIIPRNISRYLRKLTTFALNPSGVLEGLDKSWSRLPANCITVSRL